MTTQEVIKNFMARLVHHGYAYSDSIGSNMLDSAIRAASRFTGIQEVIDAMKADQEKAELQAVKEILGEEKLLEDCDSALLSQLAKNNSAVTANSTTLLRSDTTVEEYIKQRKAEIFLQDYCGIQLNNKFCFYTNTSGKRVIALSNATGNTDTGAITGADANITLEAGDTDYYGNTLDLSALASAYGSAASLSSDGKTLVIGTGTQKTDRSVVDETLINTYTASTTNAQVINTGNRDWVVQATTGNDTIISGGADSINAGAGNDSISVNANGATVTGGTGSDNIEISAQVKSVTINDLTAEDTLTISGSFEIGAAKIEDMLLVITDKTGTRKITLGDFTNATDGIIDIDSASTTLGKWLSNAGIDLDNLESTTYAAQVGAGSQLGIRNEEVGTRGCGQYMIKYISGEVECHMN